MALDEAMNWKRRGGAAKMLGQLLVGTGVVVSGISLANVKCFFQGTCASPNTVIANFFSTLEAGIVIAGSGL